MRDLIARPATYEDMGRLIEMSKAFLNSLPHEMPFSAAWCRRTIAHLLMSEMGYAGVLDAGGRAVGMLGAQACESPLSPVMISQEMCLWVEPEYRGRGLALLIKPYEDWAASVGVARPGLSFFFDLPTIKVLDRIGYEPVEVHLMKKVQA